MLLQFGVPNIFIVSNKKEFADADYKTNLINAVSKNGLSCLTENNISNLQHFHEIQNSLQSLDVQKLFNTLVVVDLRNNNLFHDDTPFFKELILCYPEIYWIFITDRPLGFSDISTKHHIIKTINELQCKILNHYYGFRTCFDPCGFRHEIVTKLRNSFGPGGHSAQGPFQSIAGTLIKRAKEISSKAFSVTDSIQAAILAREALMILRGKTLAMSLDALNIMHQMETLAECAFVGASSKLPVEERLKEFERDVRQIVLKSNLNPRFIISPGNLYAAVVDEEENYLMLNGYFLYRHGFHVFVVPSMHEMKRLLDFSDPENSNEENDSKDNLNLQFKVIMEDIDIQFSDMHPSEFAKYLEINLKESILDGIEKRANYFRKLKDANRIFVSRESIADAIKGKDNIYSFTKPYDGFFDNELISKLDQICKPTNDDKKISVNPAIVDKNNKNYQLYSALLEITSDIRQIYEKYDQLEEEEITRSKLRKYEHALKYGETSSENINKILAWISDALDKNKVWRKFISIAQLYFNNVVSSFTNIIIAIAFWVVFFAVCYYGTQQLFEMKRGFIFWFLHSTVTFFSMQSGLIENSDIKVDNICGFYSFWGITTLELVFAYLHLGILISYLYQIISRK